MDLDFTELYKWIDEQSITRQKKNINRDFSDAIPLVEILKEHYPKLVELHNYSPQNAYIHKLANWQTLNRKVLNKLKIYLNLGQMNELAKSAPGEIEKLLLIVKNKIENKSAGDNTSMYDQIVELKDCAYSGNEVMPVRIRNGKNVFKPKIVPSELFDSMEKSLLEKDETIANLQNKVHHLEHLLEVKEERIKDLTQQLQTVVNNPPSPRTRFFKGIF